MSFSVLLMGLGNIGATVDSKSEPTKVVLSHARAISMHPSFNMFAGVDPVKAKREVFKNLHGYPAVTSVDLLDQDVSPDIAVIATPPDSHAEVYQHLLERFTPKLVLMEKPVANSASDEERIRILSEKSGIPIVVNYFRRVDPSFSEIQLMLDSKSFSGPFTGACWYSKGAYNSASHFLDLVSGWFGPFEISKGGESFEQSDGHHSVFFTIRNMAAEMQFLPIRQGGYYHNSLEIYGGNGRLSYDLGGARISFSPSVRSAQIPGYSMLQDRPLIIRSDFYRSMYNVYSSVERLLRNGTAGLPNLAEALSSTRPLRNLTEKGIRL